jgi:hypothetical protein
MGETFSQNQVKVFAIGSPASRQAFQLREPFMPIKQAVTPAMRRDARFLAEKRQSPSFDEC